LCKSSATPRQSKPGPRLALVAGTRTVTWFMGKGPAWLKRVRVANPPVR
jgi:hypothetical protein